jgi:hypothetical protein
MTYRHDKIKIADAVGLPNYLQSNTILLQQTTD